MEFPTAYRCIIRAMDKVEGGREFFITQANRGEYLCKVISSTHPMFRCIMRADWTWLRGEGS